MVDNSKASSPTKTNGSILKKRKDKLSIQYAEDNDDTHNLKRDDNERQAEKRKLVANLVVEAPKERRKADDVKTPNFYVSRPSLLDYDNLVAGVSSTGRDLSFEGFVNLGIIFLVAGGVILITDSFNEKGLLVNDSLLRCMTGDMYRSLSLLMLIGLQCAMIYLLSVVQMFLFPATADRKKDDDNQNLKKRPTLVTFGLHLLCVLVYVISLFGIFSVVVFLIFVKKVSLMVSLVITMVMMVYSMKLHSYYVYIYKTFSPTNIEAESKVSVGEFLYFLVAPTLCFFRYYPRTSKMRPLYILKELTLLLLCLGGAYVLVMQFIDPVIREGKQETISQIMLAFLRICIPWFVTWLLISFAIFHAFLNLVSEITYFADRSFYMDWWDAQSFDEFWRRWNVPVHHFLLRHVYFQSIRLHFRKPLAIFFTFLLSAIIHELCMCIAFRTLQFYFFIGMLAQVPFIYVSSYLNKYESLRRWNNISMWLALFTGQPLMLLLYFKHWYSHEKALCDINHVLQNPNLNVTQILETINL